ncbi:MAG: HPF/RaiA family ribosome-associated protein [Phycisphaeraceae bacterium]
MQIQVNAGDIHSSPAIQQRVQDEVSQALDAWSDRVTRVEVHLHDEDGPKHSNADKRCVMEVRLAGLDPMVVEHSADDMYGAIQHAAGKLRKIVHRTIERRRDH